ncbi:acyl carrier protein [Streptomyces sp. NPDC057456]|uniref:acyl carrier protein n=1 Tax=Streptomyces sp. NPDC057456 TaxID=3346139 RepID=UPI003673FBA3
MISPSEYAGVTSRQRNELFVPERIAPDAHLLSLALGSLQLLEFLNRLEERFRGSGCSHGCAGTERCASTPTARSSPPPGSRPPGTTARRAWSTSRSPTGSWTGTWSAGTHSLPKPVTG